MSRRIVFAVTAAAVLAAGAGAASAATNHSTPRAGVSVPSHQLCLLLYRDDPSPQHICVNW
jgi:hypothetical protein